jgi:outer membrane protein assembly factor BamE (lipoprotein component of BamABCDE complex)
MLQQPRSEATRSRLSKSLYIVVVLLLTAVAGCTRTQSERGVEPEWRTVPDSAFAIAKTTQSEVMALLGPPSQVITHNGGKIFYYLHEQTDSRGYVFIVYNTSQTTTSYDRAIFFFDEAGVLEDYSLSASGSE